MHVLHRIPAGYLLILIRLTFEKKRIDQVLESRQPSKYQRLEINQHVERVVIV